MAPVLQQGVQAADEKDAAGEKPFRKNLKRRLHNCCPAKRVISLRG
jgi:hypothetical protein